MKKKLSVLSLISAIILLTGCSSSEKEKPKEPIPIVKTEVKPVAAEIKTVITEVKAVTTETKPAVTEVKSEIKTGEKTSEKTNVIIIVVSKEEASEILKSIISDGNYEIKGLKAEPMETKTEIKPEIKIENKPVVSTEKIVKEEKIIPLTTAVTVAEATTVKVEKNNSVEEKITEKIKEEVTVKKEETPITVTLPSTDNNNADSDKDGIPDYLDDFPNQILKETLIAQGVQKLIIPDDMKETDNSLTPQMREELDKIAAIMKKDKTLKIKIISHTNNIGDEKVNLKLSEKRAAIAETYLNSRGIPLNYVAIDWKGGSMPIVNNDTKENRAKNKRLEIIFYIVNVKTK